MNEAELIWAMKMVLRPMSATIRKGLCGSNKDSFEQMLAETLVRKGLSRFEILATGDPSASTDALFAGAGYGTGGGIPQITDD